jgi:hypothetical protein
VVPGGLIAIDDYFNQRFPGVSEGALLFGQKHPDVLTPIAIGFNKVLFQRAGASDLNQRFAAEFDYIPTHVATMWGQPVALFETAIVPCIDLDRSTAHRLVPRPECKLLMRAAIEPGPNAVSAGRGQALTIPVRIVNQTSSSLGGQSACRTTCSRRMDSLSDGTTHEVSSIRRCLQAANERSALGWSRLKPPVLTPWNWTWSGKGLRGSRTRATARARSR